MVQSSEGRGVTLTIHPHLMPRLSMRRSYTSSPPWHIAGTALLSPGVKRGRGMTLTTHPHLVPRLSMSRSYTSSHPHVPPWHVAGQLYFYLLLQSSEYGALQHAVFSSLQSVTSLVLGTDILLSILFSTPSTLPPILLTVNLILGLWGEFNFGP
jgi:hypothetical protein